MTPWTTWARTCGAWWGAYTEYCAKSEENRFRPARRAKAEPSARWSHRKRVTRAGTIRLGYKLIFISSALNYLDIEETGDGIWSIYFCNVLLAKVDERGMIVRG